MAIAHVQSANGGSNASAPSCSATFGSPVGSGNIIVGFAFWSEGSTTNDLSSISDDKGNTYTIVDKLNAFAVTSNSRAFASFYCANVTNAPTVITANFSPSTGSLAILVDEYSGVATTSPLDGHTMQAQSGVGTTANAATSGNITTTVNGDLIYGGLACLSGSAGQVAAGTGFTLRVNNVAPNGAQFFDTEDEIQSSAGTTAATFTLNAGDSTLVGVMALTPPVLASIFPLPNRNKGWTAYSRLMGR